MIHDEDDNHKYSISYSVNITMSCLIHKYRWAGCIPPDFYANGIESRYVRNPRFLRVIIITFRSGLLGA